MLRDDSIRLQVTLSCAPLMIHVQGPLAPWVVVELAELCRVLLGAKKEAVHISLHQGSSPHWRMRFDGEMIYQGDEAGTSLANRVSDALRGVRMGRWQPSDTPLATPDPTRGYPIQQNPNAPPGALPVDMAQGSFGGLCIERHEEDILRGILATGTHVADESAAGQAGPRSEAAAQAAALEEIGITGEIVFFRRMVFKRRVEVPPKISLCTEVLNPVSLKGVGSLGKGIVEEIRELQLVLRAVEAGMLHVNASDRDGRTALHLACSTAEFVSGDRARECIIFLLEMGGNPLLCDLSGIRPVDIAEAVAVPDESNIALSVLRKFSEGAKAKIRDCPLPRPVAELQHEGVSAVCFSEAVPTILYYCSATTSALCCRYLTSRKSSVLHVPSKEFATPQGFIVLPYVEALHSGTIKDIILLDDGTLLVVDHKAVDPVVQKYSTPIEFASSQQGAPLASFAWSPTLLKDRGFSDGGTCRLRPSYLESMQQELDQLERRAPPKVGTESAFATNLLLFPYAQAKPNGAGAAACVSGVAAPSDMAQEDGDSDSLESYCSDSQAGCEDPASAAQGDAAAIGSGGAQSMVPWIGLLSLVVSRASGDTHLVTLHLPWFSPGTTRDIGQSIRDSIAAAWGDVPFVRRLGSPDGSQPLAAEMALDPTRRVGHVASHALSGQSAFGMDLGYFILYRASSFSFVEFRQSDASSGAKDAPLPYTMENGEKMMRASQAGGGGGGGGANHPYVRGGGGGGSVGGGSRHPPPPCFDAPATNFICLAASFNTDGHLSLFSSSVAVFSIDRPAGENPATATNTPPTSHLGATPLPPIGGPAPGASAPPPPRQDFLLGRLGDEVRTGCFHPTDPDTLILLSHGMLAYYHLKTKQAGVLGSLQLTDYEFSRKQDNEDILGNEADLTISGTHKVSFSRDGSLLCRLNTLHKCAAVYEWGAFAEILQKDLKAVYAQKPLSDIRGVDTSWNSVSQRLLKSHLSSLRSVGVPMDSMKSHLWSFCQAIHQGRVPPCYRDSDGRTALHLALDLANSTDYVVSAQAKAVAVWLIRCGASLFTCDNSPGHLRGYDLAGGVTALQHHDTTSTGTHPSGSVTVAADAVFEFRKAFPPGSGDGDGALLSPSSIAMGKLNLSCRDTDAMQPIAELGEDCEQVHCSSSFEGIIYFLSIARGALLALNVEKQFSAELYSFPGLARMAVFPYSETLHESMDKDFILFSNGTLLRIHFVNGPSMHPVVTVSETQFRSDLPGGMPGLYLTASAVQINRELPQSADYSMGVVSTVYLDMELGRRTHLTLHLSSLVYPHDKSVKSCLDFLRDAINIAWSSEGIFRITRPIAPDAIASHICAANTPSDPGGYVALLYEVPRVTPAGATPAQSEPSTPNPAPQGTQEGVGPGGVAPGGGVQPPPGEPVIGYLMNEAGVMVYLVSPRGASEGTTVGASISYSPGKRQVVVARFARCLEVFKIDTACLGQQSASGVGGLFGSGVTIPTDGAGAMLRQPSLRGSQSRGGGGAKSLPWVYPSIEIPGCDTLAENAHGSFHPTELGTFAFLREGLLCVLDIHTDQAVVVGQMNLSIMESRRKDLEEDGATDERLTGYQLLLFSSSGVYAVRYNSFYRTFVVYSWADVAKRRRALGPSGNLTLLSGSIDPTVATNRPPRKMELKGSLKRMTTKGLSLREKRSALSTFLEAIGAGLIPPNFSDTEGKTAMHVLFDISHQVAIEESIRQAVWLLSRGANVFATDSELNRPIDALRSGTQREVMLRAINEFQQKYCTFMFDDPDPPPGKTRTPPYNPPTLQDAKNITPDQLVFSVTPSATSATSFYALCAQNCRRKAFEMGKSPPLWCLVLFSITDGTTEIVSQGVGDAEKVGYSVIPYSARLHGSSAIDFIITSDTLLCVRRTPKCVVEPLPLGGALQLDSTAGGSLSVLWCPTGPPPNGARDTQGEENTYSDMSGAFCFIAPCGRAVRTLRLPTVDHDDGNKAKYLMMLLKLASPADTTLPEAFVNEMGRFAAPLQASFVGAPPAQQAQSAAVAIRGVWHGGCGSFLITNGESVLVVSHRGALRKVVCSIEPTPCAVTLSVGSYAEGAFVAVPRPAGVDFYSVVCTEGAFAFSCVCRVHDAASDSIDMAPVVFHPERPLAFAILDNELVVYDCLTHTITASHIVTLSAGEISQRSLDGDGICDSLVGTQCLSFTSAGVALPAASADAAGGGDPRPESEGHLLRLNKYYKTVTCYDGRDVRSQYLSAWTKGVAVYNAFHLGSLCSLQKKADNIRIASALQPFRKGNIERKEGLGGLLGRTENAERSSACQKSSLGKMVRLMKRGAADANFPDADRMTALHLLCSVADTFPQQELVGLLQYILSIGGSLYTCDKYGRRPCDLLTPGSPSAGLALTTILAFHLAGLQPMDHPALPRALVEADVSCVQLLPSRSADGVCYATCNERGSTRTSLVALATQRTAVSEVLKGGQSAPAVGAGEEDEDSGEACNAFDVNYWRKQHEAIQRKNTPPLQLYSEEDFRLRVCSIPVHAGYRGGADVFLTSAGVLLHVSPDAKPKEPESVNLADSRPHSADDPSVKHAAPGCVTEQRIPLLAFEEVALGYIGQTHATLAVVTSDGVLAVYIIPTERLAAVDSSTAFLAAATSRLAFDLQESSPSASSFPSVDSALESRSLAAQKRAMSLESSAKRSSFKKRLSESLEAAGRASEIDGILATVQPAEEGAGGGVPAEGAEAVRAVAGQMVLRGEIGCIHLSNRRTVFWKRKCPTSVLFVENLKLEGEVLQQTVVRSPDTGTLIQILSGASLAVYDVSFIDESSSAVLQGNTSLSAQPLFLLSDESPEGGLPIAGAMNPTKRMQYVFLKEGLICTLDLDQFVVRTVGELRRGAVEERKTRALQLDPLNLVSFSAKGSHLLTVNEYQGLVAFHRWDAVAELMEVQKSEPTVANNAVFLPPVVAGVDLSQVYSQLIEAGEKGGQVEAVEGEEPGGEA